jgi:uncharacterized SAM-dependent methyltransferase
MPKADYPGEITLPQLDLAAIEATYKTSLASVSSNARRRPRLEDFVGRGIGVFNRRRNSRS